MSQNKSRAERSVPRGTYSRDDIESTVAAKGGPTPGFEEDVEFEKAAKIGMTFDPDFAGEDLELLQENLYQEAEGRTLAPKEREDDDEHPEGLVDTIMIEPQEAAQEENHPSGLSEHSIKSGAVAPGDVFDELEADESEGRSRK